jgi:hypothetical protein
MTLVNTGHKVQVTIFHGKNKGHLLLEIDITVYHFDIFVCNSQITNYTFDVHVIVTRAVPR